MTGLMLRENMTQTTTINTAQPAQHRPFGFWTAVSLVMGNMIGTGIYLLPSELAHFGTLSLAGYLLTALGALGLAYVFSSLILYNPRSGGPYAYGREVFGDLTGFLVAWGYWTMNWTGSAATAVGVTSYLSTFLPSLAHNRIFALECELFLIWCITCVNCLGLRVGGRVQIVLTFLKLLPLLAIPAVSFFWFQLENVSLKIPVTGSGHTWAFFTAISGSAALSVWSFVGLESATVPTSKISNPRRTVMLATLCGTAAIAILYLITLIGLFGLIPVETLANSATPFVDATVAVTGSVMAPAIISICIIVSGIGGLNGWILLHGQMPEAMAKDGLFPPRFAKVSSQGVPRFGLITGSLLITCLLTVTYENSLLEQFVLIVTAAVVMTLFAYLVSSMAALSLIKKKRMFSIICCFAILYTSWAIWSVGLKILVLTAMGYIIGLPVYWYTRKTAKNNASSLFSDSEKSR